MIEGYDRTKEKAFMETYFYHLKRKFDLIVGGFVNGKISRPVLERYMDNMMFANPAVIKNFWLNRTKHAIPIMCDALRVASHYGTIIKEEIYVRLLKCLSENWKYLFSTEELPDGVSENKQWLEMFDICHIFLDFAMKNGWYYISDDSKLFLIAKSLEEKEQENVQEKQSTPQEPQEKPAAKPSGPIPVRAKLSNVDAQKLAKSDAAAPQACGKIHVAVKPVRLPEKKLKTYNVAVMRTSYGVIPIEAENEDEAVAIATGQKPMRDGTWASELFQPTEHDSYLELNDGLDDCVSEVIKGC